MSIDDRIQNDIESRIVETPTGDYLSFWSNNPNNRDANPAVFQTPAGGFVENPLCWAKGLNFHGIGTYTVGTYFFAATLISPRHIVATLHLGTDFYAGDLVHFVGTNGAVHVAEIAGAEDVATTDPVSTTDTRIGYLTADVPLDIPFYKVLPADFDDSLTYDATDMVGNPIPSSPDPTGLNGKPVISIDQFWDVYIRRVRRFTIATINTVIIEFASDLDNTKYPNRRDYNKAAFVGGDSTWNEFMLVDQELILLGSRQTATMSNPLQHQMIGDRQSVFDATNAIMLSLDTGGTGYQLTEYEFSEAGPLPEFFPTQKARMATIGVGRPWMRTHYPDSAKDYAWRATTGLTYGQNRTLAADPGFIFTFPYNKSHFSCIEDFPLFESPINKPHFSITEE